MTNLKLIVGLGNPGFQYEKTRNNVGFMAIDAIAINLGVSLTENKFNGLFIKNTLNEINYILAKPMTFMNLSGDFVSSLCAFYKIQRENILIIHDDVSLPPGKIRLRENGSSGGQNGMADIIKKLGSQDIKRARIGIGDCSHAGMRANYVLAPPTASEFPLINSSITKIVSAAKEFLSGKSFDLIMSHFNAN